MVHRTCGWRRCPPTPVLPTGMALTARPTLRRSPNTPTTCSRRSAGRWPNAPENLVHTEFGTPRSFARYTRRAAGAVGGPPVSRRNANLRAVGPDIFGPGLWVVGDSVFPGQGTMAVVLSAIRVVERITGDPWARMKLDGVLRGVVNSDGGINPTRIDHETQSPLGRDTVRDDTP